MKKLFLILTLFLLAFISYGQYHVIQTDFDISGITGTDTLFPVTSIPEPYNFDEFVWTWEIAVRWQAFDVAGAEISVYQTGFPDSYTTDSAYSTYPLLSTLTLSDTAGYSHFSDNHWAGNRIALYIEKNSCAAGRIWAWITIKRVAR